MKSLFLSILLAAITTSVAQAQFITGFGTGDFTKTYSDFSSFSQDLSSITVQGSDMGSSLAGTFTPFSISAASTGLSLTGTITTNPASNFDIILQDSLFNQLIFTGNWSSFTTPGISQAIVLNRTSSYGSFNGIATKLIVYTNGSNSTLNFTFDALSAVPEPTSMLLLGMGLAGIAMRRSLRRR